MLIAAFDTSTPATVVAVEGDGFLLETRLDAPPAGPPAHSSQLLPALASLLEQAGAAWGDVGLLGVGIGPGTFTGLRIGASTVEGIRRVAAVPVVGVDSLEALSLSARRSDPGRPVCALIDARRSEVFASGWGPDGSPAFGPLALTPGALPALLDRDSGWLVAGEAPEAFGIELAARGIETVPEGDPRNLIGGAALCELARQGDPLSGPALPDYVREPDARRPAA